MEKKEKYVVSVIFVLSSVMIMMGMLVAGTYAWFSSNRRVTTDASAAVRSGTQNITLGAASDPNLEFGDEVSIKEIEITDVLNPVSTADLKTFFRSTGTVGDQAIAFEQTNEGYFHGRIYLLAQGEGISEEAKVKLYIDTSGISVDEPEDLPGKMINAARLGLIFTGEEQNRTVIFRLSSDHNGGDDTYHNTMLDGVAQTGDMVLESVDGALVYAIDPSVDVSAYMATETGGVITLPDAALAEMKINRQLTVDIYFYIEGCDSDCTNAIRTTEMSIHLPIYGVLEEGNS